MIIPENIENLAELVKGPEKTVFFFTAGWCGDCNFIKPKMPEIEVENPDFKFVEVDRDEYMDLAIEWGIMGIPSFVVIEAVAKVKDGMTVMIGGFLSNGTPK